jgi:hypothetical protein
MMMMTDIERMKSMDSVTPTTEDAMKYVTQETAIAFPNINFFCTLHQIKLK